jgi:hypothetical protein
MNDRVESVNRKKSWQPYPPSNNSGIHLEWVDKDLQMPIKKSRTILTFILLGEVKIDLDHFEVKCGKISNVPHKKYLFLQICLDKFCKFIPDVKNNVMTYILTISCIKCGAGAHWILLYIQTT